MSAGLRLSTGWLNIMRRKENLIRDAPGTGYVLIAELRLDRVLIFSIIMQCLNLMRQNVALSSCYRERKCAENCNK